MITNLREWNPVQADRDKWSGNVLIDPNVTWRGTDERVYYSMEAEDADPPNR